jgi:hypothetical protein
VLDSARVADTLKDNVKLFTPVRGFLWRGFLNLCPFVQVISSHLSHKVSVVSASTPIVKEFGVVRAPSPLDGCVTPTAV